MIIVWIASGLGGISASITQSCLTPYFQFGLPREDYTAAQGMFTFAATGGTTIYIAIVGVLVNLARGDVRVVFWSSAVLVFINFIIVLMKVRITDEDMAEIESVNGPNTQNN